MDDSAYLSSSIRASHAVGVVSQTMVIVAVAIPVFALLYIIVHSRRRDIGILTAMGFGPREIFSVFFAQAAVVGLIGTALGCGVGYGLIRFFRCIRSSSGRASSFGRSSIGPASRSPPWWFGGYFAGSVYPRSRCRMDPAPVFRGIV
jgi:ABC-type lipoprotein release transport system permease subunit